ncbi:hypothetical protein GCM10009584_10780 [Ornithinimicrobium humiphilum]
MPPRHQWVAAVSDCGSTSRSGTTTASAPRSVPTQSCPARRAVARGSASPSAARRRATRSMARSTKRGKGRTSAARPSRTPAGQLRSRRQAHTARSVSVTPSRSVETRPSVTTTGLSARCAACQGRAGRRATTASTPAPIRRTQHRAQSTKTHCWAARPGPASGESRASTHIASPESGGWVDGAPPVHGSCRSASAELTCTTGRSE